MYPHRLFDIVDQIDAAVAERKFQLLEYPEHGIQNTIQLIGVLHIPDRFSQPALDGFHSLAVPPCSRFLYQRVVALIRHLLVLQAGKPL
ncbi:MAG: hypothetical protein HOC74_21215 [Gemmatimonadetes bacterium]|nr:hypothetical protein [Gemmatimonadota bacterium]